MRRLCSQEARSYRVLNSNRSIAFYSVFSLSSTSSLVWQANARYVNERSSSEKGLASPALDGEVGPVVVTKYLVVASNRRAAAKS
jgi:hypothetical protein